MIASEVFDIGVEGGPSITEIFEDPLPFDGTVEVGETFLIESEITLEFTGGGDTTLSVTYEMTPATIEDSVTVPFDTVDGLMRLEAVVGGALIGGLFEVTLWLHPDHAIVKFEGSPAWDVVELVDTWE